MASGLGEANFWIQNTCRPGEGWALVTYSCSKHASGVSTQWPNQITGTVISIWYKYSYLIQIICTQLCGFKYSYLIRITLFDT